MLPVESIYRIAILMKFDVCEHRIRNIAIRAAREIRKAKGLSEEGNVTVLFEWIAPILGIPIVKFNSRMADHLPSPAEIKDYRGEFIIPNKPCPQCGKTTFLGSICQSCEAAEGGKYKSGYTCDEKRGGCGLVDDKTDEWISQRLKRIGIKIPDGTKESLGIKTLTNDGLT